ncbi:MAG: malonyl-ACP O-methyltransferase BioC [Candidatus Accumulibacter sp.]|nr:malonyl-ACP O-methyltransferase BioC [Accumulibacter sp.]
MTATEHFVDRRQVRRNFARAAKTYDEVAVLQREIGSRLLERLDYVRLEPSRVIDLGCGTGASLNALRERYPKATLLGIDLSEAMLRISHAKSSRLRWLLPFLRSGSASLLAADATALPCRQRSVTLTWSNLLLPWIDDPLMLFREVHRVLEIGGLLMFSTLGPDTLKELRNSFADGQVHTQRFIDMHDYGDMLVDCGFADPVMDAEVVTMTYPGFDAMLADLRRSGSACAMRQRRRGLTGKTAWATARQAYGRLAHDGRWPATVEVVYGHAWKAEAKKTVDGRAIVRFDPKQRAR